VSPILLILLAVAALGAIVAVARNTQAAWAQAARRLGLSHQSASLMQSPVIRGRVKGFVVEVRVTGRGGKHNTTRYKVRFPSLGLGLLVRRESFIDRALDRQDIQLGEDEFDTLHLIQGDVHDRVRAFLTDDRRACIQKVLSRHAKCTIGDDEIRHKSRGVERDADEIVATVQALVGLATILTDDSQDEASVEDVTEEHVPAPVSPDEDLDWEQIIVPVPAPDVVPATGVHVPDPVPPPAAPTSASPSDPPETTAVSDLTSETVCRELFAGDRMSFETSQIYEERFEGRRVRWSGTLDRFESYRDDPTLGSGPGIKAVLDLPAIEDGARVVHLVVALPAAEERALLEARGKPLTIEGTLAYCDPYLWTVFLVDGVRAV